MVITSQWGQHIETWQRSGLPQAESRSRKSISARLRHDLATIANYPKPIRLP